MFQLLKLVSFYLECLSYTQFLYALLYNDYSVKSQSRFVFSLIDLRISSYLVYINILIKPRNRDISRKIRVVYQYDQSKYRKSNYDNCIWLLLIVSNIMCCIFVHYLYLSLIFVHIRDHGSAKGYVKYEL